ncbi:MAG: hypothetical protein J5582_04715 [Ruminococcus sp.]|uniref:hypothetical protein n=1 Tax=Ruminococcus sp. TaxID=41978 RepID=UPI0025D38235|nr:hypothetical protein [Ruminococcus sp.]MBO4865854.1 hypothetical protein [Ruminococcus sp.]
MKKQICKKVMAGGLALMMFSGGLSVLPAANIFKINAINAEAAKEPYEYMKLDYTPPTITYKKGEDCVKLEWNEIEGAERYGVALYMEDMGGIWMIMTMETKPSFVLNRLTPGKKYRVAVYSMFDSEWILDTSNAITVTPTPPRGYPEVTSIEYNEKYHKFRLNWKKVEKAEQYGIAVKIAGKWKVQAYTDTTNINSRAFTVTVK